ncbi:MAG: VWA domain-containing protein, partial [Planctomycetota bacterium]
TLDHDNVLAILDTSETVSGPAVQQHLQEMGRAFERARASGDQRRMRQIQAEHQAVQEENQTAIGDALALAVERLDDLDRRRRAAQQGHRRIKSKVIILLTDGENNAGDLTPAQAAEVARERGVKVYAIGIGAQQRRGAIVDEEQMRRLAESTGGKYFRATGTRSLQQVYAEIDKLEKTETEERRFMQYKLAATNPVVLGGVHLWPLLLIVLILLTVEIVLGNTRLRRIP